MSPSPVDVSGWEIWIGPVHDSSNSPAALLVEMGALTVMPELAVASRFAASVLSPPTPPMTSAPVASIRVTDVEAGVSVPVVNVML